MKPNTRRGSVFKTKYRYTDRPLRFRAQVAKHRCIHFKLSQKNTTYSTSSCSGFAPVGGGCQRIRSHTPLSPGLTCQQSQSKMAQSLANQCCISSSSHTEFRDLEADHCRQDFTFARPIEVWSKVALKLVGDFRSEISRTSVASFFSCSIEWETHP